MSFAVETTVGLSPQPMPDPVPLVDLGVQHARIAAEVEQSVADVMRTTAFILGPQVDAFESAYAEFCGVQHCVGVGNGTDAIELALRGAGLGEGDEVVIPANTFVATAEAVVRAGCRVVLADCDNDFLIDAESAAAAVTPRTRAVIAVDLYGQVPNMEALQEAVGDSVLLVEDAAQSQGAARWGTPAGSFGVAAATSFYPGKNLGAYGDAGAVLTQHDEIADQVRSLRSHGGQRRYEHLLVGTNSRLDSLQAAVLSIKLRHLRAWNDERVAAAARYEEMLSDVDGVRLPATLPGNDHVWHLYVVRVPRRDAVLRRLNESGIGAAVHYPRPVHALPAFADLWSRPGAYPNAERLAGEILSLPIFPGITVDQQERVVQALLAALEVS